MASSNSSPQGGPTPTLFFQTVNAYQRTAAIRGAIELNLFTAIGEGSATAPDIARRCAASERGVRILCDYLAVIGFLTKRNSEYALTPDAAMFLDRRSPAYAGGAIEFLMAPHIVDGFRDVAALVRKGGCIATDGGTLAPENPVWVRFARAMSPLLVMATRGLPPLVDSPPAPSLKVLDIAAGHGLFGIAFATNNPNAQVVAVDWPNVLEVAKENASRAGVADRFQIRPGSAFEVDLGRGYDLVLLPNFLHHFDVPTCGMLLKKVRAALSERGRAVTVEFVPDESRIAPPDAAAFSFMMLGTTPAGDAYTFAELESMFRHAGFGISTLHDLPGATQKVVISEK